MLATGQCTACVYDSSCESNQYSNMEVCGPTSAPQCTPCPPLLPQNVLSWVNPGRFLTGNPPCDVVCRNGYVKTSNFSCVSCPNIPNNSKINTGCDWTCSLGYFQSGSVCLPCNNTQISCGVGTYLGYSSSMCGFGGQCPCCMQCTNSVVNAHFTSNGTKNGPNTCRVVCNPETFIDPTYGLDVFNNPVGCIVCSKPQCTLGASYVVSCTLTADSFCQACAVCPPGMRVSTPCTTGIDAACTPCDPAPLNAYWTFGCSRWQCGSGYYPKDSACLACKQPRNCTNSDRFDFISPVCGVCTPCNTSLLLPWQCFNGDGQCGKTYYCGFTTTRAEISTSVSVAATWTIPLNSTVVVVNRTSSNSTGSQMRNASSNSTDVAEANTLMPYAAVMTLTLPSHISLEDVIKAISCPQQTCEIKIVSITLNSTTTYCVGTGCAQRRRLLAIDNTTMVLEIIIISQQPLQTQPVVSISIQPVSVSTTGSYQVVDYAMLSNSVQLSSFIKASDQTAPSEDSQPWAAVVVLAIVGLILIATIVYALTRPKQVAVTLKEVESQFDWSGVRIKYV